MPEFKAYRVLNIRPVTIEPLKESPYAALIQTNAGLKVLIFYPFQDAKGWWSRFYDASLAPTTRPDAPVIPAGPQQHPVSIKIT